MARTKARSCGTKQQHATKAAAWDHYFSLKRKGATGIHIYKCKYGKHFHVGHVGKRR